MVHKNYKKIRQILFAETGLMLVVLDSLLPYSRKINNNLYSQPYIAKKNSETAV